MPVATRLIDTGGVAEAMTAVTVVPAVAPDMLSAMVAGDGTAAQGWPRASELRTGRHATRNLADAAHYLCVLHGRHPGVIDLALTGAEGETARAWLADAAEGFAVERLYLTRITVAAGPLPSTLGHAECEAAVMNQRHALETLALSERQGCALGAAIALVLDWRAIRQVLDVAAERLGVTVEADRLPDERETRTVAMTTADNATVDRALTFGAQQILAQHRGLWEILEARASARVEF